MKHLHIATFQISLLWSLLIKPIHCQFQKSSSNNTSPYNGVLPFTYQASGILFADWISLTTLCLAPLIVHIVSGAPSPVYLSTPRPHWHERLGHYNPTSILWRYFSILDRRVRSRAWNAPDMAASNALFWTSRGWDGSEDMMRKSRRFCSRIPSSSHVAWVSKSSAETLATVLQGLQAIWQLVGGLNGGGYTFTIALGTVLGPLAILGLLRLPVAVWISDDYSYVDIDADENVGVDSDPDVYIQEGYSLTSTPTTPKLQTAPTSQSLFSVGLLQPSSIQVSDQLHPTHSWRGRTIRILFLSPLIALFVLALLYLIPYNSPNSFFTLTQFLVALFYMTFLACSIPIYTFYFLTHNSTSTIIPCITSLWYKIYTFFLIICMLILILIAGLETRRTPCGIYTTTPSGMFDMVVCGGVSVARNGIVEGMTGDVDRPFGGAWRNSTSDKLGNGAFYVVDFDGWCNVVESGTPQLVVPVNTSRVVT